MIFFDQNNTEDFGFSDWKSHYSIHPQGSLLKDHVERAVQDIFYSHLKEQTSVLLNIFSEEKQINEFIDRMISYWETMEEYEKCSEILSYGKTFKSRWRKKRNDLSNSEDMIRKWIETAFNDQ